MLSTLNMFTELFHDANISFSHLSMDLDRRLDISALVGSFGFDRLSSFENISFKFLTDISIQCHSNEDEEYNKTNELNNSCLLFLSLMTREHF